MDQETKQMVVDALIKVVNDAPTQPMKDGIPPTVAGEIGAMAAFSFPLSTLSLAPLVAACMAGKENDISPNTFNLWIKYVFSILEIISRYVNVMPCLSSINGILNQKSMSYAKQTNEICKVLLDFARSVLNM